ncbi:hypothetical protein AYO39_00835 [Actinobacteria bacterium SCGC AG-212-D09]|nr:hypothetical protein AYO39_00835 [Actinobacteria bacterium SCGC AG-212-D09]
MAESFEFAGAADWDEFVGTSPQGTVFCESRFLAATGGRFETAAVGDGGRPELAAVIVCDGDGPVRAPAPYTVYQGILFSERFAGALTHGSIPRLLRLTTELLDSLTARLPRVSFCLHPSVTDVRPFLWFHNEQPQLGQFRVDIRYTAILDLVGIGDADRLVRSARADRRRDYSKASEQGFTVEETRELADFLRLYRATFARQELTVADRHLELVESIARSSLDRDFGRLYVSRSADGSAASMVLFVHDAHTGYYLFGANDPDYRRTGASTHLLVEAIWRLRETTGVSKIDMVGANSPNRGDYKISLGATLVPYYVVDWERP